MFDVVIDDGPDSEVASRASLVGEQAKVTDVLVTNDESSRAGDERGDDHSDDVGMHDECDVKDGRGYRYRENVKCRMAKIFSQDVMRAEKVCLG